MFSTWLGTIADPDLADWITIAAYLAAAGMAARAAGRARVRHKAREVWFWSLSAVLLCLLSINELLDMQTLLTVVAREHARAYGWYGQHRQLQYGFVLAFSLGSILSATAVLWLMRRAEASVRWAMLGLVFILTFVILRAASFHHLDDLLGGGLPNFNWGSVQEMGGILIVLVAAAVYCRKKRRKDKRRASRAQP